MSLLSAALPFLTGSCLLLSLVLGARAVRRFRRGGRGGRGFVLYHPAHHAFLRRQRLSEPDHFLRLGAVVVSGHPGRDVARVTLGEGAEALTAYLKRERRVSWVVRLKNFLAGFGFVSRCLREARTLQALEREGLPGPQWLAAGEDGAGGAFLLLRQVPAAVELSVFLAGADGRTRREVARRLGTTLARLHTAGFEHRDLYGKHVLLGPDGTACLLDWQRARRARRLPDRVRARDLAALHATLADALATPRERLACARAYLRACSDPSTGSVAWAGRLRALTAAVEARARRLLSHRHIREKRRAAEVEAEPQAWVCLDGEALCVTPAFQQLCPQVPLGRMLADPAPAEPPVTRRWLPLPGRRRTLLVRRRDRRPLTALWHWCTGRPYSSPEQRQAALLLRLERHAVPAPRVLAMGQSPAGARGVSESFLLTEPAADTVRLAVWLARRPPVAPTGNRSAAVRRRVLRQTGALLGRLHDANCYLSESCATLAVQMVPGEPPTPVLDSVEGIRARRARHPGCAARDLLRLRKLLVAAGCSRTELRRFLAGYQQPVARDPRPREPATPCYRTPDALDSSGPGEGSSPARRTTGGAGRAAAPAAAGPPSSPLLRDLPS